MSFGFGGIYLQASSVSATEATVNASKFSSRSGDAYKLDAAKLTYNKNGYWVTSGWPKIEQ